MQPASPLPQFSQVPPIPSPVPDPLDPPIRAISPQEKELALIYQLLPPWIRANGKRIEMQTREAPLEQNQGDRVK